MIDMETDMVGMEDMVVDAVMEGMVAMDDMVVTEGTEDSEGIMEDIMDIQVVVMGVTVGTEDMVDTVDVVMVEGVAMEVMEDSMVVEIHQLFDGHQLTFFICAIEYKVIISFYIFSS